jgi:NAD-dependent deacetylase
MGSIRLGSHDIPEAADMIREWIRIARKTVAFTGAGISTESGIPDFRSPNGVWAKNRVVYFDEFMESAEARYEYWRQKSEAHRDFAAAEPNITHRTLARLESDGKLHGIITQNIDGLHQLAGSQKVLELHGTARDVICMDCGWRAPVDHWVAEFVTEDRVPECPECGGRLKHATISFGQQLDPNTVQQAGHLAATCDLFIALGSSLVVYPAAGFPERAALSGARLIIVNREPTPLDAIASLVVNAPLGDVFEAINTPTDDAVSDQF